MKIKYYGFFTFGLISIFANAQWNITGTNSGINGSTLGTSGPVSVKHVTGGSLKFTTTVGNALNNAGFSSVGGTYSGDGISIAAGVGSQANIGNLLLYTSHSNQTHIRFSTNGLIQSTNNRLEMYGNVSGLWFDATGNNGTPQMVWNITEAERGRLGSNGFWRFGANTTNQNANNIIEIVSQTSNPYGVTGSGLRFKNLTSANIVTSPTSLPGGNGINPSKVLSVDKNGDVVLINGGSFGALCSNPAEITATQFTASRAIDLNNFNFEWRNGRVGFGTAGCTPGNRVEITGLGAGQSGLRFTNLTSAATPLTNPGAGVLSVNANGDVIYVPGGSTTNANNGLSVNGGVAQLGVPCSASLLDKVNYGLTTDRVIHMRGNNLVFGDGGRIGIGLPMSGPGMSCGVGNKVEIVNTLGNPYYSGGGNGSGLRFRYLTSASAVIANGTNGVNSSKVLTVDQNGDVVLTNASGAANANNGLSVNGANVQFGIDCSATTAQIAAGQLTNNRQIPTNGFNVMFNGSGNVGIGLANNICSPGSKLEINNGIANTSGLRFTQLTSSSPTTIGNGKVLTVGPNGDVLLVNDGGGSGSGNFGAPCSQPIGSSNLASDWRVGMNNNSVNFVGTGNVNIGDIGGCIPGSTSPARLWVRNSSGPPNPTTGLRVDNYTGNYAIETNGNVYIGGTGVSPGSGLIFSDKNLKENITEIGSSLDIINKLKPVSYNFTNNYAPQVNTDVSKTYGLIAQQVETVLPELVKSTVIPASYDSLGTIIHPSVNVKALNYTGLIPFAIAGIQELNSKQKETQSTLDKTGLSDAQVKTNVNSFNALAKIKTLQPVQYNFTNANVPQLSFKSNLDYGFIAQQLETVYPELVDTLRIDATYDSLGVVINPSQVLKTVNYKAMSGLLVRSIQEQQSTIDSLRTTQNAILQQLTALAAQINSCCSNTTAARSVNSVINQQDIELSDKDAIVLNQNVPNPFAEQTTITYNVPASVEKAQIIFFNTNGQVIQTVDIKTRGKGKVNVFASDLSSGLYNYSLVADGKVIDSKKMVRE